MKLVEPKSKYKIIQIKAFHNILLLLVFQCHKPNVTHIIYHNKKYKKSNVRNFEIWNKMACKFKFSDLNFACKYIVCVPKYFPKPLYVFYN